MHIRYADQPFTQWNTILICGCGNVTESHFNEIQNIIKKSLKKQTFIPSKWNLEIKGLCSKCI